MGLRAAQGSKGDNKLFNYVCLILTSWFDATNLNCFRRCDVICQIVDGAIKVYKGTNPEVDSYSVFWDNKKLSDTSLCAQLKQKGITDIYVCGLAYDVCVG